MRARSAVAKCFRQYADFTGRSTQAEFWWFYGFSFAVQLIVAIPLLFFGALALSWLLAALETGIDPRWGLYWYRDSVPVAAAFIGVSLAVWLALLPPFLAVQARRLHDMGQSGWWVALNAVGLGSIPTVMAMMPSQPVPNRWGDVPFDPSATASPALA